MSDPVPLEITSRFGSYAVVPTPTLAVALFASCAQGKTWLIIDEAVLALHREAVTSAISAERIVTVAATEDAKSFVRLEPLFLALLGSGFKRDCTLLAIGGGVIQDIAAFIAAVLVRGVRWEFIPTTLLAQCDSCIGAKSSINIGAFKNQLGCFYPPAVIRLVLPLLDSLPDEAVRSGFGEIIKFHLLDGAKSWHEIQAIPPVRTLQLQALVWKSLSIKKRYIEEDEFDRGIRNLLNYGHTFGHAFESVSGFSIPHGIAVALGMAAATFISERSQLAPAGHFSEVDAVLRRIYRPFQRDVASVDMDRILAAMRTDKKNTHGKTFVILTRGPGLMEKVAVDLVNEIAPALTEFLTVVQE